MKRFIKSFIEDFVPVRSVFWYYIYSLGSLVIINYMRGISVKGSTGLSRERSTKKKLGPGSVSST